MDLHTQDPCRLGRRHLLIGVWFLALAVFLSGCLSGCGLGATGLAPGEFLGPGPGVVCEYDLETGVRMQVLGLDWQEKGVALRIQETLLFPNGMLPAQLQALDGEARSVWEYTLRTQGEQLIKDTPDGAPNRSMVLLDVSGRQWSIPIQRAMKPGQADQAPVQDQGQDQGPVQGQCRIAAREEREYFGQTRTLVTVSCQVPSPSPEHGPQALEYVLVTGLGLVSQQWQGLDGSLELTAVHRQGQP